mgnify:CR=1 FL=1
MQPMIGRQAFLQMPTQEVAGLVRALEKPRLGVFVPGGRRRYVLTFTDVDPNSEALYRLSALLRIRGEDWAGVGGAIGVGRFY